MKYTENYVYMYGQMISTCSFLLDGDFPKADGTAEIKEKYHLDKTVYRNRCLAYNKRRVRRPNDRTYAAIR